MDGASVGALCVVVVAGWFFFRRRPEQPEVSSASSSAISHSSAAHPVADGADTVVIPPALGTYEVPSSNNPGTSYQIDLATLSCNCEDHLKRRRGSDGRDVRRCCKHIGGLLIERGIVRPEHELLHLVLNGDHGIGGTLAVLDVLEHPVVFAHSSGAWMNIWARGRKSKGQPGRYQRYGWNQTEDRWSYGKAPPGAAKIIAALATMHV